MSLSTRILPSNYFEFGGVDSRDYNAYIATSNMFDAPQRDYSVITVLGRNGNLHIDNGRFETFKGKCRVFIPYDMQTNIVGLRNYLGSAGTAVYREEFMPGEYRTATFTGAFSVKNSDRVGAYFDLEFDCSPERWLDSGQQAISITSGDVIYNPTQFDAKPLIEVVGTGTITIAGVALTLATNNSTTYIDCDIQDAYEGSINRNGDLTVTSAGFPVLSPGESTVTFSGFTSVNIYPRWWRI